MNASVYREVILDYWRHPRHFGKLNKPDAESFFENSLCGDAIGWNLKLKSKNLKVKSVKTTIEKAMFYGEGCALSIAGASVLAEHMQGMPLTQAKMLHKSWLMRTLKITPGPSREKCVTLGLEALKKALEGVQ